MALCPECGGLLTEGVTQGLCASCLIVEGFKLATDTVAPDHAPASNPAARHFGDYELLDEIARGGMGVIYRARQRSLDRIVAVKMLLFGPHASTEYVKRFRAEASAAASLQHPNIVAIHEVGVHQGEHYLVMDLVDGPNLGQFVKDEPLSAKRAAGYLKTIAEAIHYAHERGILHRDLKPSNVLVDSNDQPRVTDFGLARRLDADSSLTLTGQILGSPSYMPPEQAGANHHKVGRRSDVYSLGAMLYHMLTGRPPFIGGGLNETLEQVFHREPVAPRLLNPAVPRDLETICLKCLEKEPVRRYPSAQALADELGRFLRDDPTVARPVTMPERVWRWCRRKPALATLIALLHVVAAVGLAGILWELHQARQNLFLANTNLALANTHLANEALEDKDLARTRLLLHALDDSPVPRSKRGWEWRYLTGRSGGDQSSILDTQTGSLCGISLSTDGRWLASINEDGLVKVWDFTTKREVTNWLAHVSASTAPPRERIHAALFLSGSHTLITTGPDQCVRLWDIPVGTKLSETKVSRPVNRLALSKDSQWLAGGAYEDQRLSLWRVSGRQLSLVSSDWQSGLWLLFQLAFAPDGLTLFAGGPSAQSVRPFDISEPTQPRSLPAIEESDAPLAVSPDGRWLAMAGTDGLPLRVLALPGLMPVSTNYIGGSRLFTLRFSPDSKVVAAGLEDGRITLVSLDGSREPISLLGHESYVVQMAFSPNGKTLVSASLDKTVRLWDLSTGERAKWSFPVDGIPNDVNFSPDSKGLVSVTRRVVRSGTNDHIHCIIQIWDVDERKGLVPRVAITNATTGLNFYAGFSQDGTVVAADTYDTQWFLEAPTLALLREVPRSRRACWAPNGRGLAYLDRDRLVRSPSPSAPATTLATGNFMSLAWSPDGRTLATASEYSKTHIELRDAVDGHLLGPALGVHWGFVTWLAFSPDGKTLASAGWEDSLIGIWDVPSRQQLKMLRANNGAVYKLAFSPDSLTLATCGSDEMVRLLNVKQLQEVAVLRGHRGPVNSVAFSRDGRWLASASLDGTIRLWLAPKLEEITTPENRAGVGR
jgi:WD40 repeat protein/serine/threonine protein kinase